MTRQLNSFSVKCGESGRGTFILSAKGKKCYREPRESLACLLYESPLIAPFSANHQCHSFVAIWLISCGREMNNWKHDASSLKKYPNDLEFLFDMKLLSKYFHWFKATKLNCSAVNCTFITLNQSILGRLYEIAICMFKRKSNCAARHRDS